MIKISSEIKKKGLTIGFVPTMGFLHKGHVSLIENSKSKCDVTIVSIYVNPTQFTQNEDYSVYPRNFEQDEKILKAAGVNYLFYPSNEEIYPKNFQTFVNVEQITKKQEGEFRPSHFKGVATVVSILFNIINPDFAFFGRKDAQQCAVIKQFVKDLRFNIKIEICPIIREKDGLAMSSRNVYLTENEREKAKNIYKSLTTAKVLIIKGEKRTAFILSSILEMLKSSTDNIDYIRIVNMETFEEINGELEKGEYYILIACRIGKTRLIDNEVFVI